MLKSNEQYVVNLIEQEGGLECIDECHQLIQHYRLTTHFASKNSLLARWSINAIGVYELIIAIFTVTLTQEYLTIQTIIGMLNQRINLPETKERVKILADVIGLCAQTDLINIERRGAGHSILVTAGFDPEKTIPEDPANMPVLYRPQPMENNYHDDIGSLILGHYKNNHNGDICLDHLNKMNQIPLSLNAPFIHTYEEKSEKPLDTEEKVKQWHMFHTKSQEIYKQILTKGNRFYLHHKNDSRGRSYACGYYVTTQGSSYKKASIQLFNKEYVEV